MNDEIVNNLFAATLQVWLFISMLFVVCGLLVELWFESCENCENERDFNEQMNNPPPVMLTESDLSFGIKIDPAKPVLSPRLFVGGSQDETN